VAAFAGEPNNNLILRNNIFTRYGLNGVIGDNTSPGLYALQRYAPPENTMASRVTGNLFVNDRSLTPYWLPPYPPGNHFVATEAELAFVNPARENYALGTLSAWKNRGSDGRDPGADIAVILSGITAFTVVPGDVDGDGIINCSDVVIVRSQLGKRSSDPGYDVRADVIRDNVVDLRDLAFVSQRLPQGMRCN
jgi:hypothetical protein